MNPKMIDVLSENWTLVNPRDLNRIVRMAQEAEDAGLGCEVSPHPTTASAASAPKVATQGFVRARQRR